VEGDFRDFSDLFLIIFPICFPSFTDHPKLDSKITFLPPHLCTYKQLKSQELVPEAL
jgi:hypothetical protein